MQAEAVTSLLNVPMLHKQLRTLLQILGFEDTMKLLDARGGTRLQIPMYGRYSPVLTPLLGQDATNRIAEAFKGEPEILLSRPNKIRNQLRDAAIRADREKGMSIERLAVKYCLHMRTIQIILDRDAPASPQQEMF